MNARRHLSKLAAGAALAAASVAVVPGVAHAETTTTPANTSSLGPRIERACARIPNLQIRTDNLLERLNGSSTTVGSLAWLQDKIDEAQAAGRTQLVTVLQNRQKVRTATVPVLEKRKAELVRLADKCADLKAQS